MSGRRCFVLELVLHMAYFFYALEVLRGKKNKPCQQNRISQVLHRGFDSF